MIDHQPFATSALVDWLGAGDLAYAMVVWWPSEARRRWERSLVEHWHARLLALGVEGYAAAKAWDDYRLCALQALCVPAARCAEPGAVTAMRWLWEPQLRRALGASLDVS